MTVTVYEVEYARLPLTATVILSPDRLTSAGSMVDPDFSVMVEALRVDSLISSVK
jgi:hypothetical protein